jgi:UDP-N-acetylmuramyl pentapeptide phosphotransferase/UDP-N-acetylglucosamine-1-phosphate transferase
MIGLLVLTFFSSTLITLCLIKYKFLHEKISGDSDFSGPQKFHSKSVPRIGGIAIFFALIACIVATYISPLKKADYSLLLLCVCSIPAFITGLSEDLTKNISAKTRLLGTICSALLGGIFLNIWISRTGVPFIDSLLGFFIVSIIFTAIAVAGLSNAFNIIDGFNGLASMIGIISLLAIGFVSFRVGDLDITFTCLAVIFSIAGFFIWNYPRGLIFLGDGGAYLIGYLVASLSIILVNRHPTVSPWFAVLVNAYPIFETLFTIWRRRVHQGKNPGLPDGAHFHSLIYRRIIRWAGVNMKEESSHSKNAKTSPYLWILSSIGVFPAIIWWESTLTLQLFGLLFCLIYLWVYRSIVNFKTPKILKLFDF